MVQKRNLIVSIIVIIASANGVSVSYVDRQWLHDPSHTKQVSSLQGIQLRRGSRVSSIEPA